MTMDVLNTFILSLKKEEVYQYYEFIGCWHNIKMIHSSINYITQNAIYNGDK